MKKLKIDSNHKESLPYLHPSFHVEVCTDTYNEFFNHTLPLHWHDDLEFAAVIEGTVTYYADDRKFCLQKGDSVFINSNVTHTAIDQERSGAVLDVIAFSPLVLSGSTDSIVYRKFLLPVMETPLPGCKIPYASQYGKNIYTGIRDLCYESREDFCYELSCLSTICSIYKAFYFYIQENAMRVFYKGCTDRKAERNAKKMITYIWEHFREPISVCDIADAAGTSRSECFRYFREFTGKTPVSYMNEYRLGRAAGLLAETDRSIMEIAEETGFFSCSYFSKIFRKNYEVSPLQYRKSFARPESG